MESRQWINKSQPQTLLIGCVFLYLNAVLQLVYLLFYPGGIFVNLALLLLFIVLPVLGGLGVANERKWGYYAAVAAAVLPLLRMALALEVQGVSAIASSGIVNLLFVIVPIVLILHPMSRSYQKLWFH